MIRNSFNKLSFAVRKQGVTTSKASDAMRIVPEEISNLLECLPDAASLHEKNGASVWVSEKAKSLLGLENDHTQAPDLFSTINPQDQLIVLQALSDCYLSGETREVTFRSQIANKVGQLSTCNVELKISRYTLEEKTYCLCMLRDVTQQMQELTSSREQADIAQSSNDTKSLFISNVSHELRTPLNAIIGFSQMLMGEAALEIIEEKKLEYAGLINQSASHLLTVINDILDLSKMEAGKFQVIPEAISVEDELRSTINLLKPIADAAGITVHLEVDSAASTLNADPRAFRQIMINLIANAIKFSHDGKTVQVCVKRTVKNMIIEVIDQGIGMDAVTVSKLGATFYQADQGNNKQYEGSGLGLSIVAGLVELHDGTVAFDSAPNQGTTVSVKLPIASNKPMPIPYNPDEEIVFLSKSKEPNLLKRLDNTQIVRKVG